ncbi:MAG: hypothetical protein AAGE03_04520 [Pseudomonadota bacterium]
MPDAMPQDPPTGLTDLVIGGLSLHGEISAERLTQIADRAGYSTGPQARAVLDLVEAGLASVMRSDDGGTIQATPALTDLPRSTHARAILTYVAAAKAAGVFHA